MVRKHSKTAGRKLSKSARLLIALHRQFTAGVAAFPADKVITEFTEVAAAIERGCVAHNLKPQDVRPGATEWLFLVAKEQADRRRQNNFDYAERQLRESLTLLQDAQDMAECIFKGRGISESGLTAEAFGGYIRASVDYARREIEGVFPGLGFKAKSESAART